MGFPFGSVLAAAGQKSLNPKVEDISAETLKKLVWPGQSPSIPPSVDRGAACFDNATNSTKSCGAYGFCEDQRSESQDPGHCECFSVERDRSGYAGGGLEEVGGCGRLNVVKLFHERGGNFTPKDRCVRVYVGRGINVCSEINTSRGKS